MVSERWYHIGLVGTKETGRQVVGWGKGAHKEMRLTGNGVGDWDKEIRHRTGVVWEEGWIGGRPW